MVGVHAKHGISQPTDSSRIHARQVVRIKKKKNIATRQRQCLVGRSLVVSSVLTVLANGHAASHVRQSCLYILFVN